MKSAPVVHVFSLSLCFSRSLFLYCGSKGRAALLGFVLRRAKIYLRDSLAFINGNGGGARALRAAV